MNKKTKALTTEQYKEIVQTMREGFTGFHPNERIATALVLEPWQDPLRKCVPLFCMRWYTTTITSRVCRIVPEGEPTTTNISRLLLKHMGF